MLKDIKSNIITKCADELVEILREMGEEIPDKEPTPKKCPRGRKKYVCKECDGDGICQHKKQRAFCIICGGSQICQHNRHELWV